VLLLAVELGAHVVHGRLPGLVAEGGDAGVQPLEDLGPLRGHDVAALGLLGVRDEVANDGPHHVVHRLDEVDAALEETLPSCTATAALGVCFGT